jgi:hypothetical protein
MAGDLLHAERPQQQVREDGPKLAWISAANAVAARGAVAAQGQVRLARQRLERAYSLVDQALNADGAESEACGVQMSSAARRLISTADAA